MLEKANTMLKKQIEEQPKTPGGRGVFLINKHDNNSVILPIMNKERRCALSFRKRVNN